MTTEASRWPLFSCGMLPPQGALPERNSPLPPAGLNRLPSETGSLSGPVSLSVQRTIQVHWGLYHPTQGLLTLEDGLWGRGRGDRLVIQAGG